MPAVGRVLAFDPEAGILAFVSSKGNLGRLDLRSGDVRSVSRPALTAIASANGSDIYGVTPSGTVSRSTPAGGSWTFAPVKRARFLFPQGSGSLVIASDEGEQSSFWLVRPPDDSIIAARNVPARLRAPTAQAGDRIYFTTERGVTAYRVKDLGSGREIPVRGRIVALSPTPSGDRLYAAAEGSRSLFVIGRFSDQMEARIDVPGEVSDLRMDPLGRYLLARSADADSAWVVALGTSRVIGSVKTRWLTDLPAFAPDGRLFTARGNDVVALEGETLAEVSRIRGGASDFWYFFSWNGFRPRAEGLDEPVSFPDGDSAAGASALPLDSVTVPAGSSTPAHSAPPGLPAAAPAGTAGFTLSFAALLSEDKAKELAASITVGGTKPRVVPATREGATIYRVVLGPFPTREEAERIGRQSGRQFWVYEGAP